MKPEPDEPEVLPEAKQATIVCPECGEIIRVRDVHAFLLSEHQQVCRELTALHGTETD